MMNMSKLKRLRISDLFSPFILILLIPIVLVHKLYLVITKKRIILICEDPKQACDNGYDLFQFMSKNNIKNVYYAITKDSKDLEKFVDNNSVVYFYSLKHWIYYLNAYRNISIHKASSPSPPLFYILQKYKIFNGNRVFLQHGVTMNYVHYLKKEECHFKYFITAAIPEHDYVLSNFGYNKNEVKLLGFPRFDQLLESKENLNREIAIMPTWRSYLRFNDSNSFQQSDYYKYWQDLLNDRKFNDILVENNLTAVFLPHRNIAKFTDLFIGNNNIKIVNQSIVDIKDVIHKSPMIITDYSSISIDFAYSGKPVIYFQFDTDEFRKKHLAKGYFSYQDDGFGKVTMNISDLNFEFYKVVKSNFILDNIYEKRRKKFFKYLDTNNSRRITDLIL